jgi:hypothetical protein
MNLLHTLSIFAVLSTFIATSGCAADAGDPPKSDMTTDSTTSSTTGSATDTTTGSATSGTTGSATDTMTGSATDTTTGSATDTTTGSATDTTTGSATDTTTGSATDTTTGSATGTETVVTENTGDFGYNGNGALTQAQANAACVILAAAVQRTSCSETTPGSWRTDGGGVDVPALISAGINVWCYLCPLAQ